LLENIERAVELGVMSPLSLAIDAELVFPALPTPERLRAELARLDGPWRLGRRVPTRLDPT
jgi:hypothetical protein